MDEDRKFMPTPEWLLQQKNKYELHEYIQRWGERVAPSFEHMTEEEKTAKESFFAWLMQSVTRDDQPTADLIKSLDLQSRERIGYSYYRETTSFVSDDHPMLIRASQRQFDALFTIYEAGGETREA